MAVDNYYIADQFSLLSKLMDINGENSFKSKNYSIAAFNIEKLPSQLSEMEKADIFKLKGIGDSTGKKIIEILEKDKLEALEEILSKTPPGIVEMLSIKGLGPKKINTVWKEMGIESIGELLYACNENRLLLYKGFGEKTQKNVQESIEFYFRNQGSYLYAETEDYAKSILSKLKKLYPKELFEFTGAFRRQVEIITQIEWVTTLSIDKLVELFESENLKVEEKGTDLIKAKGAENISVWFHHSSPQDFHKKLFATTSSVDFDAAWTKLPGWDAKKEYSSEESIFEAVGLPYLAPYLREKETILARAKSGISAEIIQPDDIKGIIHSHSNWSDGSNTVEEMAKACIQQGYEYLVISDHSKSAFYANGLSEERIKEQHNYVNELNAKLAPFKIFKSIEADILNDGALDYSDNTLSTFDLVIASVHSNLKMTIDKAMSRLVKAIENPFTTILGHMTGRLLLSRPGYPVDHAQLIEACVKHKVVIELNAHPRRLDIDWRWIDMAIEKGALISIDPDAHSIEGYHDCRYGVLAAQKAGVTKRDNLSSFSLKEFEDYLASVKQKTS